MDTSRPQTTVLTLRLDERSMEYFESLRQKHFPPTLNRIPAHLTLFHQLPLVAETNATLAAVAAAQAPFSMRVSGLRSLGRGVAYKLESDAALHLHAALVRQFQASLIPQDRQPFHPHIVVQNKATPDAARDLLKDLQSSFTPHEVTAVSLDWWEYLGGPWKLLRSFQFGAGREAL